MSLTIIDDRIQYQCSICGAKDCKLWREWNTFLNHQSLYCVVCACADQKEKGIKPEDFDDKGYHPYKFRYADGSEVDLGRTDQLGYLCPAVPTEDEQTFWGYSSVPQPLVDWWRALPTRPTYECP